AYLAAREADPAAILCTLQLDANISVSGLARYPQGGEPILNVDGERIVDRKGRSSYVTTAGSAPSLDSYLMMVYLPPEHAIEGTELYVEYMAEQYPVTVARVGRTPL